MDNLDNLKYHVAGVHIKWIAVREWKESSTYGQKPILWWRKCINHTIRKGIICYIFHCYKLELNRINSIKLHPFRCHIRKPKYERAPPQQCGAFSKQRHHQQQTELQYISF